MPTRKPFGQDEWYHCYTRGVEKRKTFESVYDYERFLSLLYMANGTETLHRSDFNDSPGSLFVKDRGQALVSVGAYCIMPNHFHLLLKEKVPGGISKFMQKLGTAYTMYFNLKHQRVGNLFVTPFRAKHIADDRYFKKVIQYIHLNPVEIFESGWKEGDVRDVTALKAQLKDYPYSSLPDYVGRGVKRPEHSILDQNEKDLVGTDMPPISRLIDDARVYFEAF